MADLDDGATHQTEDGIIYISDEQPFQNHIVSCDLAILKIQKKPLKIAKALNNRSRNLNFLPHGIWCCSRVGFLKHSSCHVIFGNSFTVVCLNSVLKDMKLKLAPPGSLTDPLSRPDCPMVIGETF